MPARKHGHSRNASENKGKASPTYSSWCAMKTRCNNPNFTRYSDYGGRGITYDSAWEDYDNFLIDMGERPEGTTLDRIDVNKGYCKSNCRWGTEEQQKRSRRDNHNVSYNGKTQCLKDWATELGISYTTLHSRINRSKWSIKKAFNTPTNIKKSRVAA